MLKEFKEFAMQGNVLDLAIGVIIGGAFGGVVNSVVNDLLMPVIGMATGGLDFKGQFSVLKNPDPTKTWTSAEELVKAGGSALMYGQFISVLINFIIVAFCIFMIVKAINKLKKPAPVEPGEPAPTTESLLAEIRDVLKARG